MIVKKMRLVNFRNYESLDFAPAQGLSILIGENAQGKTNLLEAIFLCAVGRSHRTSKDGELIGRHSPGGYVRCDLQNGEIDHRVEIKLGASGKKQIKIDGTAISKIAELMGCLNAVFFSPEDLSLVKDGPSGRRRFMDLALCQTNKRYFHALTSYQKALAQRNALLKEVGMGRQPIDLLRPYNELMAQHGSVVGVQRHAFAERIGRFAAQKHAMLSAQTEQLHLQYETSIRADTQEQAQQSILQALTAGQGEDIRRAVTLKGLHRDDLKLSLNQTDLRSFGSQGQQRCAALALKLAELDLIFSYTGHRPVLLLDDVLSELDLRRQACLLEAIGTCQTLITCTHLEQSLANQPGAALFAVPFDAQAQL